MAQLTQLEVQANKVFEVFQANKGEVFTRTQLARKMGQSSLQGMRRAALDFLVIKGDVKVVRVEVEGPISFKFMYTIAA
jgi:hypothetical protein